MWRIYVKNQHPEEIRWWREKLITAGFDPALTKERVNMVFMYLKDAGVDFDDLSGFAKQYDASFSAK
jgi:hypothetical protein